MTDDKVLEYYKIQAISIVSEINNISPLTLMILDYNFDEPVNLLFSQIGLSVHFETWRDLYFFVAGYVVVIRG